MQLLLSKRADVIIGYDLQLLEGIQRGFRKAPLPRPFSTIPRLLTHADVTCRLKDKTLLVSSSGQATWWPAEGAIPAERRAGSPLYLQYSTFVVDDAVAQQAYVSSEVFQCRRPE